MQRIFQLERYPIPLPETCEVLAEASVMETLRPICQKMGRERGLSNPNSPAFSSFFAEQNILGNTHHFEVIVQPGFQWGVAWERLKAQFPHIAWTKVGRESIGSHDIYSYEFIPVTLSEGQLSFSLGKFVAQRYPEETEAEQAFMQEVTQLTNQVSCWISEEAPQASAKKSEGPQKKKSHTGNTGKSKRKAAVKTVAENLQEEALPIQPVEDEGKVVQLLEELKNEHNAKERMRLANQKMEIIVAQIENYNMQRAMDDLAYESYFEEDWAKRLKISLKEYSILMQKARFLEQLWFINRDLETRVERMTVSETQLTYEREQVKRLKERLSPHEIYLVVDECHEIEKRCKVRTRIPWRKPYAKIMQMDYDSLKRKAQYFDLLQGENVLLDQVVHKEEGYD